MPVYPGTSETRIETVRSASGGAVLSEITMTSHAGTHIDAPNHALAGGHGIDSIPLDTFFGRCRVLDLTACHSSISKEDLLPYDVKAGERILFKTNNSVRGFDEFYDDYVFLESEAAEHLAIIGVALVGIDSLSVKQRGTQDNRAHTALLAKSIPIIEGLNLADASTDEYTLCAFPLAFKGIDGSPARAVLITA